ncbi:phage antirepressor N-terminal domain-containing protein [Jiulongibacter sediminis]|uniref:phage antirepressor N-terminal domain-containing protein n=1 Tax=Jiulongibacter sediminis TaxID=1605367 RepID=UPI0026EB0B4A|nr:phage antirepressor N-terminal domain-containing protein [Jiulongibacter sediminis]
MNTTELVLGKVNGVDIKVIHNENKLVPIKPICDAIGIDMESQRKKIKEDPILSSTTVLSTAVGKDGKQREMQCLPLKYIFGWLFRIDSRNVNEEAREMVLQYQMMCYDLLYDYFAGYADYVETKQNKIEEYLRLREEASLNFRTAKDKLSAIEKGLKEARGVTYESYKAADGQFNIFGEEEQELNEE